MKRISGENLIIIIMFAFVTIFTVIMVNQSVSTKNSDKYYNRFYSENAKRVYFDAQTPLEVEFPVYNALGDNYFLSAALKESTTTDYDSIYAVYGRGNFDTPAVYDGRWFTEAELISSTLVAVVGKCTDYNEDKTGKYYTVSGQRYDIVGFIGYENRATDLDYAVWINLSGYFSTEMSMKGLIYTVDAYSAENVDSVISEMKKYISEDISAKNASGEVSAWKGVNDMYLESNYRTLSYTTKNLYSLAYAVFIVNILVILVYYSDKNRRAAAIKKLCGYSKSVICAELTLRISFLAANGCVIGLIGVKLLMFTPFSTAEEASFMLLDGRIIALTFVSVVIVGAILSLVPVLRAFRVDTSSLLK